ncbi:amino acid ABC transporter permease [Castellaniella caeni]|uniref:amino acid ABC transporter permease n=1 Tax=Castellaniella caeni TaxID=266123 RepID=UPI00082A7635|nr:amino acid ABC transporter permease [Castellaniella caeni]
MQEINVIIDNWPTIASGLSITVLSWLGAVVLGIVLGCAIAVLQLFAGRFIANILRVYIEFLRSVPDLILLFLLYYGGPSFGLTLDALSSGIVALGIYGSAYFAEIFRAGFMAVPKGQIEAADCLGITRLATVWRIQIPQMLVMILPPLTNMIIFLSKETAILSIITVPELTAVLTGLSSEKFIFMAPLALLCIAYLALGAVAQKLGASVEHRVGRFLRR